MTALAQAEVGGESTPHSTGGTSGRGGPLPWLAIAGAYLVASLALLHPLLRSPRRATIWPENDAALPIWGNAWVAHAVVHLENPFFSPAIAAPRGFNLLANTTETGLGLLLTPVTLAFGPIASFNLELVVVPAASALAMAWALRPWTASWWGSFVGGLAWGFCPFALASEVWGWMQFLWLVTPPLLLYLLSDLWHFRRLPARRIGLLLGALLAFQLLVGVELLVIVAIDAAVVVAVLAVDLVVRRRATVGATVRRTATAAMFAALVIAVVGVPTALFATEGRGHLASWVWDPEFFQAFSAPWRALVEGPVDVGSFTGNWRPTYPSVLYFGPLLLAALVAVAVWRWRDPIARVFAAVAVVGLWLMRGPAAPLHPWSLLWHLGPVRNVFEARCVVMTWFGAAGLLGVGAGALATTFAGAGAPVWRRAAVGLAPLLAIAQLAYVALPGTGLVVQTVAADRALASLPRVRGGAPLVVTYPYPNAGRGMVNQAGGSFGYDLVGAYGPLAAKGSATQVAADHELQRLAFGGPSPTVAQLREVALAFASWGVDDVVVPVRLHYVLDRGYVQPYRAVAAFTEVFGIPRVVDGEWVWSQPMAVASLMALASTAWHRCVVHVARHDPWAVPSCVTDALAAT